MKILYIHQYFATPNEPGGTRSYWISRELIEQGHEITMLTTKTAKEDPKRENIDDINVISLDVPYRSDMGILQRFVSFVKFMLLSSIMVLRGNKYDLVIATSTPLTVGFPALVGKKLRNIPYIFEVRDLWPEVPIQMGALKNKGIIKLAKWFEKSIYKNAKHIVALSPGMYEGVVDRNIPKSKVSMIPNMSKIDEFWPREADRNLIKNLNLSENSFKVVYFGSMGIANGMDYIIDAIGNCKNSNEFEFLFLGGGAMEPHLKERCRKEHLSNVHFLGAHNMREVSEIVNLCDVSLVTFQNLPILATNSPNKLFDSLSAGKPIIVNSPGWTKLMVEQHECGLFVDPDDPKDFAEKLNTLKKDPDLCYKMGINSRKLAEEKYDKSILCNQFSKLLENLV